jgi:hypothetical protein
MKRTSVSCKLMRGCGGSKKNGTIYCDDFAWRIRKLYPKDWECCSKDGRCIGREEGKDLRDKKAECGFREECISGENCCGSADSHCTFADGILKEREISRLKEALPNAHLSNRREEILYQLTLAGETV